MSSVEIHQQDPCRQGYVWDAEDAVKLRRELHLLGAFLGGVANFKSQNAVSGLPLEVGPDEVAYAVAQGRASVLPPALLAFKTQLIPESGDQDDDDKGAEYAHRSKRQRQDAPQAAWLQQYYQYYEAMGAYSDSRSSALPAGAGYGKKAVPHHSWGQGPSWLANAPWLKDYYRYYENLGAYGGSTQQVERGTEEQGGSITFEVLPIQPQLLQPAEMMGQQRVDQGQMSCQPQHAATSEHSAAAAAIQVGALQGGAAHPAAAQADWKAALQDGAPYAVPVQAQSGNLTQQCDSHQPSATHGYPTTQMEHIRHTVFKDLHSKGYAMSAGPKFGADVLAYPGDPSLYHAQFTVRFMKPGAAITPLALKGAARGSHAARKHLLLATVHGDSNAARSNAEEQHSSTAGQPLYITIAPEAGFGKAA